MAQSKAQTSQTREKKNSTAQKRPAAAQKKKKGSAAQHSTAGKRTAPAKKTPSDLRLRGDILFLMTFAFCLLLFIGNLGLGGVLGKAVSSVSFGLFGLMAYLLPFLLFYCFLFILANGTGTLAALRLGGLSGLYVFICSFFQLVLYGYEREYSFTDYYTQSALDRSGGGFFGGAIVKIFGTAFGTIGAYVIILIGLVIFTIMLTQKPLVSKLREHSEHAYDAALVQAEERHELAAIQREARKAEQEERSRRREEALQARREEAIARKEAALAREQARLQQEKEHSARRRSVGQTRKSLGQTPQPLQIVTLGDDPAIRTELPDIKEIESLMEIPDDLFAAEGTGTAEPAGAETPVSEAVKKSGKESGKESRKPKRRKTAHKEAPAAPAEASVPEAELPEDDGWAYPEELLRNTGRPGNAPEEAAAAIPEDAIPEPVQMKMPEKQSRKQDATVPAEKKPETAEYVFPPLSLLRASDADQAGDSREYLKETAALLKQTLHTFGVEVTINHISCGPTVTRYELTPQMGIKVSKILSLTDDIKLNLAAADIRIEAPIPGKAAIGIEVPNKTNMTVMLRDLLESPAFDKMKSKLAFAVGKDIAGQPVIADIAKMPHLLIAGATGSGKSVCINALIMSILYKAKPDEVKFIMIDPKVVELSVYNGIPHLFIPVVTDPKKATGALNWAVSEMTERYQRFAEMGVRDLAGYNARIDAMPDPEEGSKPKKMSRIVIIVDELADLMMVAKNEAEDAIVRLAQLARAAGLHLIIATQRPSVDVITGLIKANMPSRIALSVTSGVDSRTILDMNGAEKLLGKGDMLFYPQGYQKPARVQCAFVSDEEIQDVVDFLKEHHEAQPYDASLEEKLTRLSAGEGSGGGGEALDQDAYFADAGKLIIEKNKASIGMLQRAFRIGFNRAARIMDQLCDAGVVGEEEGTKPRQILMCMEQFENYLEEN